MAWLRDQHTSLVCLGDAKLTLHAEAHLLVVDLEQVLPNCLLQLLCVE
jgi:hypothetical protein